MGEGEAIADPTVVTGTFLLDSTLAYIPFDNRSGEEFYESRI